MPLFREPMEDAFTSEPEIQQPRSVADFRWQALFQRTSEPLFLLNRQRRFLFVNRAWEELTGLSAVEARGLQCLRRPLLPQDPWDLTIRAVCCPPPEVLHGKLGRARRLVPRTDAAPRWWEIEFLPVLEPKGLLGVLGKITALPPSVAATTPPLPEKLAALRERLRQRYSVDQLASNLPAFQRVIHQVYLASHTAIPVLLLGEPGTGKHWVARAIHYQGTMREGAFAALDCARLPSALSAAVLFGDSSPGRQPCPGTRYLKEPSFLSRDLQMQLTACLGENEASTRPRIIAGCSTDVEEAIRSGRLAEEFACALSTLSISLPPLRERLADLPLLVERFLVRSHSGSERAVTGLTAEAWDVLRAYSWPGNLRELYTVLQGACQRTPGDRIDTHHLPAKLRLAVRLERMPEPLPEQPVRLDEILEQAERRLILSALRKANGNRSRAAVLLSICARACSAGWRHWESTNGDRFRLAAARRAARLCEPPLNGRTVLRMRFPQVLIYESDGRIADLVRRDSKSRQWSVREPRRLETCLRLLRRGGPSVLVLKIGADLVQELTLLDRVRLVISGHGHGRRRGYGQPDRRKTGLGLRCRFCPGPTPATPLSGRSCRSPAGARFQ